jgi:PAS domain S-box-containing protein
VVRILLVEDNVGDARLVEILLSDAASSADFEVVHCGRLGEALGRLEEAPFEVVLLDLSLPDSSGLETVSRMREAAPRTPMVVLSGQDNEEVALQALQSGAQDYLIKGQGDGDLIARTIRYAIERQRAEEALQQSEERYRAVVEQSTEGMCLLDVENRRIVESNRALREMLGYTAQELEGMEIYDISAHTREDVASVLGRVLEEGREPVGERKYRRKDGTLVDVEVGVSVISFGDKKMLAAAVRDVTERKEAEETLRRSLRELADLRFALDESSLVAMTDEQGVITYANDRFCAASGYSRKELVGGEHRIVDPEFHPEALVRDLWQTVGRGEVWRGEVRLPDSAGSYYWLDATIVPSLDEVGRPYRHIAICKDITARKDAEETLRTSLKELMDLKFAPDEE